MSAKDGDVARLNSSLEATASSSETPLTAVNREVLTEPNPASEPKGIGEFAGRPDFPQCVLGELVDIGGRTGTVTQIAGQSLKVKSPQGAVQSFNPQVLRKLYGPVVKPQITPHLPTDPVSYERPRVIGQPKAAERAEENLPEPPPRVFVAEPDFEQPLRPITDFVDREDFPKCAYGLHVEIGEFAGVVVEIVKQSLKVRGADGYLKSYNGPILRKLYGGAANGAS
jgi:hypothetical protein